MYDIHEAINVSSSDKVIYYVACVFDSVVRSR